MKPFDLEKALAGEPVLLRCGIKAFIKFKLPEPYTTKMPLIGYYQSKSGFYFGHQWCENGSGSDLFSKSALDIIGMWQEPLPRVQLDLPAPLKDVQQGQRVYFLNLGNFLSPVGSFMYSSDRSCDYELFKNGGLFATKQDAQEWLDEMRNARQ